MADRWCFAATAASSSSSGSPEILSRSASQHESIAINATTATHERRHFSDAIQCDAKVALSTRRALSTDNLVEAEEGAEDDDEDEELMAINISTWPSIAAHLLRCHPSMSISRLIPLVAASTGHDERPKENAQSCKIMLFILI